MRTSTKTQAPSLREQLFGPLTRKIFLGIVFVEVVSLFVSQQALWLNGILWAVLVALVGGLSLWRLRYGVYAVMAELLIGSKGYLFWLEIGEFKLSLRLGFFLVVVGAWLVHLLRTRSGTFFKTRQFTFWALAVLAIVWGIVVAVVRGQNGLGSIFLDVNGYLFLGLAPVFFFVWQDNVARAQLWQVVMGAFLAALFKTSIILFLFSHELLGITPEAYTWIRETGVGEIGKQGVGDGSYYRVFFQSHLFGLCLFLGLGGVFSFVQSAHKSGQARRWWLLLSLSGAALMVLISLSRSLWLALFLVLAAWGAYTWWKKRSWKTIGFVAKRAVQTIGIFLIAIAAFVFLVRVPLPGGGGVGSVGLISERTTSAGDEAATSSRKNLFFALLEENFQTPILGSGFGTTVTYITEDPRFIDTNQSQEITTFSFEWGYQDIWLKMGLFGVFFVGYFVWMARQGWRWSHQSSLSDEWRGWHKGLVWSMVAVLVVHATTPYINHPLGIGWLVFVGTYWAALFAEQKEQRRALGASFTNLSETPTVAVHAVTYNSQDDILPALRGLAKQSYQPTSIRVYDNASSDETVNRIQSEFPSAEVIEAPENGGFTVGQNALAARAQEDLILLLNPDTVLEEDYIERLVKELQSHPELGVVQGTLLKKRGDKRTTTIDSTGLTVLKSLRVVEREGGRTYDPNEQQANIQPIFGVTGALPLYRRETIQRLQETHGEFMDETFFMYKDDVDLAYRLAHLGIQSGLVARAVAYHDRWETGSSPDDSASKLAERRKQKPVWMQQRSTTNHWALALKNVYLRVGIYNALWIVPFEAGKFLVMLFTKPRVLFLSILALLKALPVLLRKRQRILAASVLYPSEQHPWQQ